jgi:hypothetical protein
MINNDKTVSSNNRLCIEVFLTNRCRGGGGGVPSLLGLNKREQ